MCYMITACIASRAKIICTAPKWDFISQKAATTTCCLMVRFTKKFHKQKELYMQLDIISYHDVLDSSNQPAHRSLVSAVLDKGIVGISHVPTFSEKSRAYVNAARQFAALPEEVKKQYTPDRDAGITI